MEFLVGFRSLVAGSLCGAALLASATTAAAQEVTLSSFDGAITLRGDLLDFDGESYRIATAIGDMSVDAMQVSCEGEACPAVELLTSEFAIAGSQTVGEDLMPALVEAYAFSLDADITEAMTPDADSRNIILKDPSGTELANVSLDLQGSRSGLRALFDRDAQLAMSSRAIRPNEADLFRNNNFGSLDAPGQEHVIALDGLIAIVSRANPVRAISIENLARIFAGQITNWSQIGGVDAEINIYVREEDSGTRETFDSLVLQPFGLQTAGAATEIGRDSDLSDAVAQDPFGIGFTGFAYERNARAIGIAEVCGIITPPTQFTIKSEEYPLSRRLFLYQTETVLPAAATNLVKFIESDEAQEVVAASGFVDQAVSSTAIGAQGLRLATAMSFAENAGELFQLRQLSEELLTAERLSTTFRFQPGSSRLDVRAQSDAVRLADYLARGGFDNSEVLVLGFTDSIGRSDLNQALSLRRAQQVLDSVISAATDDALADIDFNVAGYGEISPLGCNETFNGRRINRRVEIWVRDRV